MVQPKRTASHALPLHEGPQELRLSTWMQLVRTFTWIERRIGGLLAKHDITLPQFDVLATLRFSEGVTQQTLAERLLVTKGNVCGLLDRLEAVGWVDRRHDPADARANRLHLTAKGRKKIDAIFPEHHELIMALMSNLPEASLKSLRQTLGDLEKACDTIEQKEGKSNPGY